MLHFLTKLLEQGVGHAFLFPQESLKKVREKFDGGVALMSTRPFADWTASHKASYPPASKEPLVRKRLYLYCIWIWLNKFTRCYIRTELVIKFNCASVLRIPIVHAHDVSKQIPREKKIFHRVENVIKQLVHTSAVRSSRYEALGKFGEHSRS